MGANKWQKKGHIWDKLLWCTVSLQSTCLEIKTWSQTDKKRIFPWFLDELGEIPGVGPKQITFRDDGKCSESEWNE